MTENREQRTENREQRTENREQRTENREQRTENREQRTENREQRTENREQDSSAVLIFLLGLVGAFYFITCPFATDEAQHFWRAFEISTGKLLSSPLPSGAFGDTLPKALQNLWVPSAVIDWADTAPLNFTNTAMYAFVNYLPQATGIFIARLFTDRVLIIHYAGKLANFLAAFSLCAFALSKIPFGKKVLFTIMVFPMTLQEMVSLAPDAFINSLSFAFIAFVLYLAYQKETVTNGDITALGIMLCLIALFKMVYLEAFLLVYMIPKSKMEKRSAYMLRLFIPLVAVALNLVSLAISSKILVISKYNGTSANEQVKFILTNPLAYAKIFIMTLIRHTPFFGATCIGAFFGYLDIPIPLSICALFLLTLIYASYHDRLYNKYLPLLKRSDSLLLLPCFFFGLTLILTSEYIGWNPPRAEDIIGVHGRYFTPLLPCLMIPFLYIPLSSKEKNLSARISLPAFITVPPLILNFIVIAHVYIFIFHAETAPMGLPEFLKKFLMHR